MEEVETVIPEEVFAACFENRKKGWKKNTTSRWDNIEVDETNSEQ